MLPVGRQSVTYAVEPGGGQTSLGTQHMYCYAVEYADDTIVQTNGTFPQTVSEV
jgi:hypothetical protein